MLALDRRGALRPVAIQSDEGARLLVAVPEDLQLVSAHAVGAAGHVASAGDAAAPIAAALRGGAFSAPALRLLGQLTRAAYRLVAGNRSRLGRLVTRAMLARADERIAARRCRERSTPAR